MRLALRSLLKQPLFTAVAVGTIAIAIGANTLIFSVANWVLLRGIPGVARQSELMTVQLQTHFGGGLTISFGPRYRDYMRYRTSAQRVAGVTGVRSVAVNFAASSAAVPERLSAEVVTDDYFSLLGVPAAAGRLLGAADTVDGAPPTVVISQRLWQRALGGAPGVVGTVATIDAHAFTIVGVAGAEFEGTGSSGTADLWIPFAAQKLVDPSAQVVDDEGTAFESLIVRVRPGVTAAAVKAEAEARLPHEGRYFNTVTEPATVIVQPGIGASAEAMSQIRRMVFLLLAGVGLVLFIACANVANLLLARGATRRREVALRRSLGASSWNLARQLLAEGMLLAAAGGGLGVLIALWGTSLLRGIKLATWLPELPAVPIDGHVLAFAAAVSVVTAVVFSLPPLLGTLRADPATMLRNGGHGATGRSATQGALVIAQVAVSFVLVVGAVLFTRTVRNLRAADLGFQPEGIATFSLDLVAQGYTPQSGGALVERLVERLRARPGITGVATAGTIPFTGMMVQNVRPVGQPAPTGGAPTDFISLDNVSPSYFQTLGIPLLRGRGFTDADVAAEGDTTLQHVVIVSETLAKRFWPGGDPLGQLLEVVGSATRPPIRVIGVAADVKTLSPTEKPSLFYYMPERRRVTSENVLVRSTLPRALLLAALRDELAAVDPKLPMYDVYTLRERADRTFAEALTAARLTSVFGVIGLLLALVGLYAVIAFTVAQRTRELAIRLALGAGDARLRAGVVRDALRLAAVGVAVGGLAAWQLARLVASGLYGVGRSDPASYAVVALLMALCAVVASLVPAVRATRVDPMLVMRAE